MNGDDHRQSREKELQVVQDFSMEADLA